jgi:hypothetical protein
MTAKFDLNSRFLFAKDYRRANGQWSWGVYDNVTRKFVEGGFFSKDAARESAARWNADAEKAVR